MARTPIWKSIAVTLEQEISSGHYRPGDKIPTEAALSDRFGVNRHTIRHALSDLGERGIVRSRRGAGVFVQSLPTEYPIGRRVRFHQNIRATGRLPEKRVLRLETRPGDAKETEALGISPGDTVVVYEGLSLAADAPIAQFQSVFPHARVPDMARVLNEVTSVTDALKRCGIPDYVRAETRINAVPANATQALHLRIREGDPVIRTTGINTELGGEPIEFGTTWFAGDRVTLTLASED